MLFLQHQNRFPDLKIRATDTRRRYIESAKGLHFFSASDGGLRLSRKPCRGRLSATSWKTSLCADNTAAGRPFEQAQKMIGTPDSGRSPSSL